MRNYANDDSIITLRKAARIAAHEADFSAAMNDTKTTYTCIEAAYAALDVMFEIKGAAVPQTSMNENASFLKAAQA